MIACISPSDYNYEENISTLNYAMKTNSIKNKPLRNLDSDVNFVRNLKDKNKNL